MSRNMANGRPAAAFDGDGELALFPDVEARPPFGRLVDASPLFEDPLLRDLLESRPVQRLRRIGFLGAVDRMQSRNRHSRYDHSIGVARLALLYARIRDLSLTTPAFLQSPGCFTTWAMVRSLTPWSRCSGAVSGSHITMSAFRSFVENLSWDGISRRPWHAMALIPTRSSP